MDMIELTSFQIHAVMIILGFGVGLGLGYPIIDYILSDHIKKTKVTDGISKESKS